MNGTGQRNILVLVFEFLFLFLLEKIEKNQLALLKWSKQIRSLFSSSTPQVRILISEHPVSQGKHIRKQKLSDFSRSPMSNPAGILKVLVVQGKRLVVRDFKSSDPYVKLKLGNQVAKTKVINSCLNPVWNEELTFSLTEPIETLNLEVFDKDRFKADDKMGYAHVNLQPLVSAARLKQILKVSSGETSLRKVIPESDNCLVRDSCINCVNGEIVQEVWLRLCGVESGEIELKLKFEKL